MMRMTFKRLTLFTSILGAAGLLSSVQAETLIEAVDTTIKSNPIVLAESSRRLSVDKTIDQARSGYYPTVDLDLGIGKEWTENSATGSGSTSQTRREAGIVAKQMLYDGFATKRAVEQSQSLAESAGYSVADTAEGTGLRAAQVYLDVLRRQELHSATLDNLASHERIYSQIKLRTDSGVGDRVDLEQTEGRLALAQANVLSTEGNLQDARSIYQRVVGHFPEELSDPGLECCDKAPATIEDALKLAYNQHPALRAALAQHEAALAQQKGAEAPFHPRADLEFSSRFDNNLAGSEGKDEEMQAMARMDYNLLNGGADKARLEATGSLSEKAKEETKIAQRSIERDVRLAWTTLKKLTIQLPVFEQRIIAADKTREAYQQQFNLGQRKLLDLLDTENEMLSAQTDFINAYYDRLYACYWLAETMGQLLKSLQLQAPETAITVASPSVAN